MLMNLNTLQWDKEILDFFDIPEKCLPKILCSSDDYGYAKNNEYLKGIKITG
jgi:glycerol kinase